MERHVPPATHFTLLDLSSGGLVRVPLDFLVDRQEVCKDVVLSSQEIAGPVRYSENLSVEADLQFCGAGSATFTISDARDLTDDVKEGAALLYGACAVSPILSSNAWHTLGCEFIPVMVASGRAAAPSVPPLPEEYPWGATMLYPTTERFPDEAREALMGIARIVMAAVINHCRAALARNSDPEIEKRYRTSGQDNPDGPDEGGWFTKDDV